MIRNTQTQIILAEQSKNYERAYRLAMNAVDETSRMLRAMASYTQAKQTTLLERRTDHE
jgi:hypothetical protein